MALKVIRWQNDMVMVLDDDGQQVLDLQGAYSEVKDRVLANTPSDTQFFHGQYRPNKDTVPVSRENW